MSSLINAFSAFSLLDFIDLSFDGSEELLLVFRYNIQHIEVFALMGQRAGSGNSPTQRVLIDWGTKVSVGPQDIIGRPCYHVTFVTLSRNILKWGGGGRGGRLFLYILN